LGGVFHFLKDGRARGLGVMIFLFLFVGVGEGLFFLSEWLGSSLYIFIFGCWRCRGHLDLFEFFLKNKKLGVGSCSRVQGLKFMG